MTTQMLGFLRRPRYANHCPLELSQEPVRCARLIQTMQIFLSMKDVDIGRLDSFIDQCFDRRLRILRIVNRPHNPMSRIRDKTT